MKDIVRQGVEQRGEQVALRHQHIFRLLALGDVDDRNDHLG